MHLVELNDLEGLSQPKCFYDSKSITTEFHLPYSSVVLSKRDSFYIEAFTKKWEEKRQGKNTPLN